MTSDLALPLQQHPHFADALTRMGRQVEFLEAPGATPVLAVRQFGQLMTSRSPIWRDSAELRRTGLRLINADAPCDDTLRAAGFRRLMTNAHVAELDLTGTSAQRQCAMKPKWRNAWRKSQGKRFTCAMAPFSPYDHQWLLSEDRAQQRSKQFRGLPHTLVLAYAASHPAQVQVLTARESGAAIAAMLFLLHAPVVTYHIGWTTARGRDLCAHHHMIMYAANCFASQGHYRLDLGTVDTDTAPGLARFKIGTGARVRPLGGSWLRLPGC